MTTIGLIVIIVNVAIAARGIFLVIQIEHYRDSLQKLLMRMERIQKEPHP